MILKLTDQSSGTFDPAACTALNHPGEILEIFERFAFLGEKILIPSKYSHIKLL